MENLGGRFKCTATNEDPPGRLRAMKFVGELGASTLSSTRAGNSCAHAICIVVIDYTSIDISMNWYTPFRRPDLVDLDLSSKQGLGYDCTIETYSRVLVRRILTTRQTWYFIRGMY